MNQLKVFETDQYKELKEVEASVVNSYLGFVYVLEWGDKIKIGFTRTPYQRLMALNRSANHYADLELGRIAISEPHTNYAENEKTVHHHYSDHRKASTELFNIPFEKVVSELSTIVIYKDESAEIERRGEAFLNGMKSFLLGGFK